MHPQYTLLTSTHSEFQSPLQSHLFISLTRKIADGSVNVNSDAEFASAIFASSTYSAFVRAKSMQIRRYLAIDA